MTDLIRAPWSPEQVAALNAFQQDGGMHPFTCGALHSSDMSPTLVATPSGWTCPTLGCEYTQDWAHAFMVRQGTTPASPSLPATEARTRLLQALDASYCQALGHTPEGLLAAYEASRTQTVDRTALRELVDTAIDDVFTRWRDGLGSERPQDALRDAVLAAVLPATTNHDTDTSAEPPLDPNYSHEACGFHWHGRDGMDIPMRDGQPVCPRCELTKVQKKLDHTQKMRDEVGVECKRRGKRVLEQSERVIALERQVDEVQRQLGAEILRAGQAEAALRRRADETAATEAQFVTVEELAHAIDNSTPYPVELTSNVLRYMAERMLEMTEVRKKASHEVWQEEEEAASAGVGPEPTPL